VLLEDETPCKKSIMYYLNELL